MDSHVTWPDVAAFGVIMLGVVIMVVAAVYFVGRGITKDDE